MKRKAGDIPWSGKERIQWACVLCEMLGENTLKHIPLMMSGLKSVWTSPPLQVHQEAIRRARVFLAPFTTERILQRAVQEFDEWTTEQAISRSYTINAQTLAFERSHLIDARIERARALLTEGLPSRFHDMKPADPTRPSHVYLPRPSAFESAPALPLEPFNVPESVTSLPQYNLKATPAGPIEIPRAALETLALELDEKDKTMPEVRPGNWQARLKDATFHEALEKEWRETKTLTLEGVKHLLGLPGSGKTTLLILIALYLSRQGLRSALFFTSIEVARQYMETLERYGGAVGMLVGQSRMTRQGHANRLAEAVAAEGDNGFAHNLFGTELFESQCLLPAFAQEGASEWQHGFAPCKAIWQRTEEGRAREHLCPLWGSCGRNQGVRELTQANIWVGHVLSMDTRVPPHASDERLRFFELIARTFDLVIFDECDHTQAVLDDYGALTLSLSGSEASLHTEGQKMLTRLAGKDSRLLTDPNNVAYARAISEFGVLNHALVHALYKLRNANSAVPKRFENSVLTTARMINELLHQQRRVDPNTVKDNQKDAAKKRLEGLWEFWDSALFNAFYERNTTRAWQNAHATADRLGAPLKTLQRAWRTLTQAMRAYLVEDSNAQREVYLDLIARTFLTVSSDESRSQADRQAEEDTVRLLAVISLMVLAYKRVLTLSRKLVSQELMPEIPLSERTSTALDQSVPRNILGTLSGVRYSFGRGGNSAITVKYLVINSVPRMLMHHFNSLQAQTQGPAVLLVSATSFLEASPAYHVAHKPSYLISSTESDVSKDAALSRYVFRPVFDAHTRKPLRFSGGGSRAEENMKRMVDDLLTGGRAKSELYHHIRTFDANIGSADAKQRRKAGIVVNSYAQVRLLKQHINRRHADISRSVLGVVSKLEPDERRDDFITPAQVESIGDDPECDILIFPMTAIGRGVNIVFSKGPRVRKAALGTLYFLTRPHPPSDDLTLLLSLSARATQTLEQRTFDADASLGDVAKVWRDARRDVYQQAQRLLSEPLQASRLSGDLFEAFSANIMVNILQTIGRAMRGGSPVQVFFVDAAWSPRSADEEVDTRQDSMLVMMRSILEACLKHPDSVIRHVYKELYLAFLEPLRDIQGVNYPPDLMSGEMDESLDVPLYLMETSDDRQPLKPDPTRFPDNF